MHSTLQKLPLDTTNFEIESCVSYTKVGTYQLDKMELSVRVVADGKQNRIKIHKADSEAYPWQGSFDYNVTVTEGGKDTCTKFYAQVTHPLDTSGEPVSFEQEVFIPGSKNIQPEPMRTRIVDIHRKEEVIATGESENFR